MLNQVNLNSISVKRFSFGNYNLVRRYLAITKIDVIGRQKCIAGIKNSTIGKTGPNSFGI